MPRVRRLRREAPTLELLAATLPELRLGLSGSGARTLAYEVFEKLGYGAVAVTDTNRVLAFVGTDPDRARELILAFADYCRWTLARPGEFITLAEELRHVQSYLALEQARFGPQLEVEVDAKPDALEVRLPPFLVQPLVENAVKHGKTERPLRLVTRARVRRGRLRVTVRDNGRGIAREALERVLEPGVGDADGAGLGLANVHGRLAAFYGEGVRLRSGGFGTVVRLDVPAE